MFFICLKTDKSVLPIPDPILLRIRVFPRRGYFSFDSTSEHQGPALRARFGACVMPSVAWRARNTSNFRRRDTIALQGKRSNAVIAAGGFRRLVEQWECNASHRPMRWPGPRGNRMLIRATFPFSECPNGQIFRGRASTSAFGSQSSNELTAPSVTSFVSNATAARLITTASG